MERKSVLYLARAAVVAVIFATGFFCGSVTQRNADAEQGLGSQILKEAESRGGFIGSAAQLGTAINEMQQHVNGLQKNLDVLRKLKSSLGGKKQ